MATVWAFAAQYAIAFGIRRLQSTGVITLPIVLMWLVNTHLLYVNYAAMKYMCQTPAAATLGRFLRKCISTVLFIVVMIIGVFWQSMITLPTTIQRVKNSRKFIFSLQGSNAGRAAPQTIPASLPPPRNNEATSLPTSTYQYQTLEAIDEIRLLELMPSDEGHGGDQVLCGRIIHARLRDAPEYVALSYCWNDVTYADASKGQIEPMLSMDCLGQFLLTRNLFAALQSARPKQSSDCKLYWIDQICINQQDFVEKSAQVALMKDTYRQASSVLVWLGEDTPQGDGRTALQFADHISKCIVEKSLLSPEFDFFPFVWTSNELGLPPLHTEVSSYIALMMLLNRPWFARSWIVQEVSLNPQVEVMCGPTKISFEALSTSLLFCSKGLEFLLSAVVLPEVSTAFHAMIQSSLFPRRNYAPPSQALLDVLVRHRGCRATLARDKIFAFLNISQDSEMLGIRADYRGCTRRIFINTAVAMIRHYGNLDILSTANIWSDDETNGQAPVIGASEITGTICDCADTAGLCPEQDHGQSLPSWVPDWAVPTSAPSFQSKGEYGEYFSTFQATGISRKTAQFRNADTQLGLDGHVLDRIVEVGPIFYTHVDLDIGKHYRILKAWENMCGASGLGKYSFTGEDMMTAFCSTITCGGEAMAAESSKPTSPPRTALSNETGTNEWLGGQDPFSLQYRRLMLALRGNWIVGGIWPGINQSQVIFNVLLTIVAILLSMCEYTIVFLGFTKESRSVSAGFRYRIFEAANHRRFVRTETGFIGLAAPTARPGDCVTLFAGGAVPILLRDVDGASGNGKLWEIVGDAYIHGAMFGEAFREDKCKTIWIH